MKEGGTIIESQDDRAQRDGFWGLLRGQHVGESSEDEPAVEELLDVASEYVRFDVIGRR